ncbi:thiol reductant ABC exporter subunit CydD [Pseudoxanthomonas dokdonensis]|uniref:thiol reductant ABC exporter subunit CydD n=1 Tax=Pseudoxanthomonas dokdonensis TaxID=344882 RepID=UPI000B0B64D7
MTSLSTVTAPAAPPLDGPADTGEAPHDARLHARTRLRQLGQPGRPALRKAMAASVVAGWLLVPQAAAVAWVVQAAFIDHTPPDSWRLPCALMAVALLLRALLAWSSRRHADQAVETIRIQVRHQLVRSIAARGPLWLRRQRSGSLSEITASHVDALEGYFAGFMLARAEVMLVPLAIVIAVFSVDVVVGTVLLLTMPLIPVFMMLVGWGAEAASRRQLQALARMGGHFADRLRGLGLIRLYGQGPAELAGVEAAAEGLRTSSLKVLRIAFLSSTVMEFFASISVAMIAVYLGLSYLGMLSFHWTQPSLATGVFCLLLAPEFYAPLRRLATHYHDRASALAAVSEMDELLAEDAQPNPASTPAAGCGPDTSVADPASQRAPAIHAAGVSVRPLGSQHPVIQQLDFELAAGQRLALVGASGGGKSTLLEALAGWLPLEHGTLQLQPARAELCIGYAAQRPYLFHGSIADNLRMARPTASWSDIKRAADAAQVSRFAERLPQGWDTAIGERGFGLSGGEARRIALARVFLRQPDLLLLDEPTAFLDRDTEAALLDALDGFCRGRTLVMATHSVLAMRMAGQVLSLPDGTTGLPPAMELA